MSGPICKKAGHGRDPVVDAVTASSRAFHGPFSTPALAAILCLAHGTFATPDECVRFAEDLMLALSKAHAAHERRRRAAARKRPANVIDFATAAADLRLARGSS